MTAWKVSQAALLMLKADSWESLGFQMQQVPSLYHLMAIEGKVVIYDFTKLEILYIQRVMYMQVQ